MYEFPSADTASGGGFPFYRYRLRSTDMLRPTTAAAAVYCFRRTDDVIVAQLTSQMGRVACEAVRPDG